MLKQLNVYIWMIMVCFMIGMGLSVHAQTAHAYSSARPFASMTSTSPYCSNNMAQSPYGSNTISQSPYYSNAPYTSENHTTSNVAYQFRTTSIFLPGTYVNTSARTGGTMRKSIWDDEEPEDDPIGTVPDASPVGDTPWILFVLLAAIYTVFRTFFTLRAHR